MDNRQSKGESGQVARREAHPDLNDKDIEEMEKATMEKVNRVISALEVAIAEYEGAPAKPEELSSKMAHYRSVHDALADWQKKALQTLGVSDRAARVKLLWEFVDLCQAYLGGA